MSGSFTVKVNKTDIAYPQSEMSQPVIPYSQYTIQLHVTDSGHDLYVFQRGL